ncbi:hypothetical protein B9Z55_009943 [Caenorhabditis nigoni]|uniref:MARVEL domain-containing protein n=1 Tax=Caenorhabditis nigoni TaxID=1611254 RepID=A0A2G5UUA0_9PELO|nr:hypothetical protein B9Z55_009943 [Caenorhabditis nigoni]
MVKKSHIAILALSVILLITFALNTVGIFTPSWVVSNQLINGNSKTFGLVPYRSDISVKDPPVHEIKTSIPWFGVSCVLMYLTFALFIIMIALFGLISFVTIKEGLSPKLRILIDPFSACSLIVFLFTLFSILQISTNLTAIENNLKLVNDNLKGLKLDLGYSAYLSLSSSILLFITVTAFHCASYKVTLWS